MSEDYKVELGVVTRQAHAKIDGVVTKTIQADAGLDVVDKKAKRTFNQMLSMAQQAWGVMDAMFRAAGINISMQTRLLVRSGFAAISVLTPVFAAIKAKILATPYDPLSWWQMIQVGIGLANLVAAGIAIAAAEAGENEAATRIAALTEGLSGINMMIPQF